MTQNRTPLQYAFFAAGGQSQVARAMGLTRSTVNSWFKRGFPHKRCLELETVTHGLLNRQLLRPHDWHIHWPELAQPHPSRKGVAGLDKREVV